MTTFLWFHLLPLTGSELYEGVLEQITRRTLARLSNTTTQGEGSCSFREWKDEEEDSLKEELLEI